LAGAVDINFPLLPLFDPTLVDSVYERDKCTDETCPFVTSVHVVDAAVLIVFGIQPFCCNTVITVCGITGMALLITH
jgi:hypothetical protein